MDPPWINGPLYREDFGMTNEPEQLSDDEQAEYVSAMLSSYQAAGISIKETGA